ncbi:MAG: glyoxalase [Microbacteriaceae bacterium]|jgi:predicted lactoylglutathione lyase|nr:glyoxalase [Microbacteriaceae bacterium]
MTIPARLSIVTLGVADLGRSVAFYEAIGWTRSAASNDDIAWFALAGCAIGLFPRGELAADIGVPDGAGGFGGITLAINVESEQLVDAALATAVAAGGSLAKSGQRAEWGGYSGYFADLDANYWEVAFNPEFPIAADGSILLP